MAAVGVGGGFTGLVLSLAAASLGLPKFGRARQVSQVRTAAMAVEGYERECYGGD